jgi:hypothetical protein
MSETDETFRERLVGLLQPASAVEKQKLNQRGPTYS